MIVVYGQNHHFGLGPIPKQKPKLADTETKEIEMIS